MRGPAIGFDPERLRQARARAGLTQADVAERLGLRTATAITNWETGRRVPAVGSLRELARVLQVDPLTLIAEATADPAERTLRDLRARKGLRQMDVAGQARIVYQNYGALERGAIFSLRPAWCRRLAKVLGVTPAVVRAAHAAGVAAYRQRVRGSGEEPGSGLG